MQPEQKMPAPSANHACVLLVGCGCDGAVAVGAWPLLALLAARLVQSGKREVRANAKTSDRTLKNERVRG